MRKLILLFTILSSGCILSAFGAARTQRDSSLDGDPIARQYSLLEKAVEDYQKLKEKDDWAEIKLPAGQNSLKVHSRSAVLEEIKKRLSLLGDFRAISNNEVFTPKLEDAVMRFQRRHGLEETGVINSAVIRALNVPLDTRIKQLQVNMDRLMAETMKAGGKRIVANIPEYKLHVFENKREVLSMDIVVGKTTNQTVVFDDMMEQIVFSPYWNVPESIVRNEILPAMRKNSRYLRNNNMEITGTKDGLPEVRQKPGPQNSLGKVKFLFPNKYNIYFHDTPAKTLFQKKSRAFSHGCIRLSNPFELARYLLKDDPDWTEEAILKAMNAGSERWVTLKEQVPVSIIYYTAWVDRSGDVNFRDDIYGRDKEIAELN